MKSARLYTQFHPESYDVTFNIDEAAMRFSGSVTIHGAKVGRPSKRLTFNQHELTVTSATIEKTDKTGAVTQIPIVRLNKQETANEIRLHTEDMLYPGKYTVHMEFEAPITTGMTGIYPCFFKDDNAGGEAERNTEKQLIMTQFESHHARQAFPCIDEPEAKAVFTMHLSTRKDIVILGNTPIAEQSTEGDVLHTTFQPTPRMSTYLLAFVMGDLQRKSATTARGTEVNVWATTAQPADSLDFALDTAKRSIEYFEDYFGVDYPLPKADHVACPDFSAGAMENWGLITYRERVLLAYPGETAQSTLEQIALVIAHETSHQWFGNLVTMKWWDDLWLNESFANMMEYQAVDSMHPEWHVWDEFISSEGLSAFRRDAIPGVQPVRVAVHEPDEISSLFDPSIVYAKGGRLLYMLKNYVGDEAFRKGLSSYFAKHAYSNTVGTDLWNELGAASGKDIAAFMDPWLTRSGFPLVSIDQDGQTATLRQEHFLDDPAKADAERKWPVPLFASADGQPDEFTGTEQKLQLQDDTIVRINTEARGHYLVRYVQDAQKQDIIGRIRSRELGEAERLMLLNGSSMQARAGYEPYGDTLQMLTAYDQESSEPVWGIMALVVGEARRFIDQDDKLEAQIKTFVDKLVASQVARLGWDQKDDESAADQKLRALVLGLGAYAENKAIVQKATELFAGYKDNQTPIAPELRGLAFIVPVKNGDDEAFDFLLNQYDHTQNGDLKSDLTDALTATRNPERAKQLLARLKDPKLIKPQDVDAWLVYMMRNRYTRDTAWGWMVENWEWIEKTFRSDKSYDYLPRYAASCVNTREYQKKFHELFDDKQDQLLLRRNIQIGFEEIETRLAWLERDLESVRAFFTAQSQ
jgi:aminopeptidase N